MSFDTISLVYDPAIENGVDYLDVFHIFGRHLYRQSWEVWQKYAALLPMKGYSLISFPSPMSEEYIEIAISNHNLFIKTVSEHLNDFQEVLGLAMTPEEILNEYVKGDGEVFRKIRLHDGLFGTLLGYGRENAWSYMGDKTRKTMRSLYPHTDPVEGCVMRPICRALESEETNALRIAYQTQGVEIDAIYRHPDFLELVLQKLSGG